jgi:hypothetical protein
VENDNKESSTETHFESLKPIEVLFYVGLESVSIFVFSWPSPFYSIRTGLVECDKLDMCMQDRIKTECTVYMYKGLNLW